MISCLVIERSIIKLLLKSYYDFIFLFFFFHKISLEVDRSIGFSALMKLLSANKRPEPRKKEKASEQDRTRWYSSTAKCYKGVITIFQFRIHHN